MVSTEIEVGEVSVVTISDAITGFLRTAERFHHPNQYFQLSNATNRTTFSRNYNCLQQISR